MCTEEFCVNLVYSLLTPTIEKTISGFHNILILENFEKQQ